MEKIIFYLRPLFVAGVLIMGFNACEKDATTDMNGGSGNMSDLKRSENIVMTEQQSDEVDFFMDNSDEGARTAVPVPGNKCASVTVSGATFPRTTTLDFGATNCTGDDGVARRGKIMIHFSGPYLVAGTVITYTTQDYYVNDNKVDLNKTVTNMGVNANGKMHFAVVQRSVTTMADGSGSITHQSTRDREWLAGANTVLSWDDVFLYRGTGQTSFSDGATFTNEIITPLRKEVGYRYLVHGVLKLTRTSGENTSVLVDFGYPNGKRDNQARVTFENGTTQVITLR